EVGGAGSRVLRTIWDAVVEDLGGDHATARQRVRTALLDAAPEGAVRMFADAGPRVLRLVRAIYLEEPDPFLQRIIDATAAPPASPTPVKGLVEQLSEKELAVLRYLPSRLSNPEIAERLYVSLNTVKTHLKHLYRKLEVTSRSEAIKRAEELGLL